MKKTLAILMFVLATGFGVFAQSKTKVYLEVISNDSKTVDYTLGVYPGTYAYHEPDGIDPYSSLTLRVVNSGSETLRWNDRSKIFILLKNGTLFCNYLTAASEGEKTCSFTIYKDGSHDQTLCFSTKFDVGDIDKVFLYDGTHDQVFSLVYDEYDSK
ncbi:MAG TPA: hypothetical protein VK809_12880 [Bacteroidia bacterium]|jgi:hypothetical protein|nr:hypothetical protein [Bacteroidia bacterium]